MRLLCPTRMECGVASVLALVGLGNTSVHAQPGAVPEAPYKDIRPPAITEEPHVSLWDRQYLTGDWGGARTHMSEKGLDWFFLYEAFPLANLSGGIKEGAVYQGLWIMSATMDFNKLTDWQGLTFRATSFYPHGPSPSARLVGDRLFVSNIDLNDAPMLWDLWVQQNFWQDKLSVRLGQYLPVEEFASGDFAGIFTSANFSRLGLLSQNFLSFAIPSQGLRVRYSPSERFYAQAGVFDGNPDPTYGITYDNASLTDVHFDLDKEGLFTIYEVGWKVNQALKGTERPRTYKLGAVYHTGPFPDYTTGGQVRDDFAVYAAWNEVLWWQKDERDKMLRAVGVNLRIAGAPADRNFFNFYFDAGLGFPGIIPGRPNDVFGSGVGYAKVSRDVSGPYDYEMVWENTYKIALTPWWEVQPTIKYVVHPGASSKLDNAVVAGLRTTLLF